MRAFAPLLLALAACAGRETSSLDLRLIHAIWTGDEEAVDEVLRRGANPDVTLDEAYGVRSDAEQGKQTPLQLAVDSKSSLKVFKALLAAGANPDRGDARGDTPLARLIEDSEREPIALALVAAIKDVRGSVRVTGPANDGWFYRTSYAHLAVGSLRVLAALIERGASPVEEDSMGETPLHAAVRAKELESVRFLLEKGVPPSPDDKRGRTPYYWTTLARHLDALLAAGTSPESARAVRRMADDPRDERDVEIQCLLRSAGARK